MAGELEPVERRRVEAFRRWCRTARESLGEARAEIDSLNVYPVPDGDTGTNLYLTLESAARAAEDAAGDLPTVARTAARAALLGARGNSGVIVAQMMRGAAEAMAAGARAPVRPTASGRNTGRRAARADDAALVTAMLGAAAEAGYSAVEHPVEGTMLTVARAAAGAARDSATAAADGGPAPLPAMLHATLEAAREALRRTPEQLEVLARAGVVDAGGRGITVLLEALDEVLTGRRPPERPRLGAPTPRAVPPDLLGVALAQDGLREGGPGYEVMYLLDAPDERVPALRETLDALGDSLVVVGGDGLWNVHVHVDDVGAAVEAGVEAGRPHRIRVTHFAEQQARQAERRRHGRAVVAVAAGPGLAELFQGAGAIVVATATGHRPSTAQLLAAVRRADVPEVVLLPNERDGLPAAEAAAAEARSEGLRVAVIPTTAQVQGLAALAVHEPGGPFDADVVAMTTAAGHTRHGAVTVAARAAVTSAGVCRPGDVLGVVEGDFVLIGDDLGAVALAVTERMLALGGDLVTLVTGTEGSEELAELVAGGVRERHPGVDTVLYAGGQPRYPLLIGVE